MVRTAAEQPRASPGACAGHANGPPRTPKGRARANKRAGRERERRGGEGGGLRGACRAPPPHTPTPHHSLPPPPHTHTHTLVTHAARHRNEHVQVTIAGGGLGSDGAGSSASSGRTGFAGEMLLVEVVDYAVDRVEDDAVGVVLPALGPVVQVVLRPRHVGVGQHGRAVCGWPPRRKSWLGCVREERVWGLGNQGRHSVVEKAKARMGGCGEMPRREMRA